MPFPHLAVLLLLATACACGADRYPACDGPGAPNPATCPTAWAGARDLCSRSSEVCRPTASGCSYVGAGDLVPTGSVQCWATAVLGCFEVDAGVGEWRCAQ